MTLPVTLVEPGTVRLERVLPGPLERLWAYLTDSKKRATWLAGGEFDLRVGGRVRLEWHNSNLSSDKAPPEKYKGVDGARSEGAITRLEPMRLLAYTWSMNGIDTEVSFELAPRGKEVLLTIVHRRLDGRDLTVSVMSGWDVHTGILEDLLNGLEPRPFWRTHGQLEKQYAAAL